MIRAIVILCTISGAHLEIHTFQHQMYMSRKSRPNTTPIQTGYVYSRASDGPGLMTTFDNSYVTPTERQLTATTEEDVDKNNTTSTLSPTECQAYVSIRKNKDGRNMTTPERNEEHIKAETKCTLGKDKDKESVEQGIKSIIPAESTVKEMFMNYDADKYRVDYEDVRTDFTNTHNGWPYSYNGPYEYQTKKVGTQQEKAEDKQVLLGADTSIIPVHEILEDDKPHNPVRPRANSAYYTEETTDNPIYGNQAFFSFVLNDYFDRNNEEYPLTFKDFSWGEEFDHGVSHHDMDDSKRHTRRLEDKKYPNKRQDIDKYLGKKKYAYGQTVTEKVFSNNQEYEKNKNDDEGYDHLELDHGYKRQHEIGFKDFVDAFANQFGSDNNNKESTFMLKQNQDKGEKKKGFRRVYHKDEYQEDNEFYDNTNKKAEAVENGDSKLNNGGSQAVLKSHAVASVGNDANSIIQRGNAGKNLFEKKTKGNERRKLYEGDIKRYRNIAKDAAQSNSADYIDQYGI